MIFELKRVWAISALLVLIFALMSVPPASSVFAKAQRLEFTQAEDTVFLNSSGTAIWAGDCSGSHGCTQDSPCSVSSSELQVIGSNSCKIVFIEGVYGPLNVSSNVTLTYSFIGAVASLNLTTLASSVKYSRFDGESSAATLQGSLQTLTLPSDDSISLVLDSMAFTETSFLFSSKVANTSALNIDITTSTFSLSSGLAALFEITVPEGATPGSGSFSMKSSSVSLSSSLTTSLLASGLSFVQLEISNHSKLDSVANVFQVPSSGLKSVTIYKSTISNFKNLVTAASDDEDASFINASLIISESSISGALTTIQQTASRRVHTVQPEPSTNITLPTSISSFNPSSCMNMVLDGSLVSNMNLNCFNSSLKAAQHACSVTIEKSVLHQNLLCILGTPTTPATATFRNSTIYTLATVGKSNTDAITRFKEAKIDAQDLRFECYGTGLASPPLFEGNVSFSPASFVTFTSLGLLAARLQISNLTMPHGEIFFWRAAEHDVSLLEPLPSGPSQWTFITPLTARTLGSEPYNHTIDFTRVQRVEMVVTVYSVVVNTPIFPGMGVAMRTDNMDDFMESLRITWPEHIDPVRHASYHLTTLFTPYGITSNESRIVAQPGDRWLWDAHLTPWGLSEYEFTFQAAGLVPPPSANASSCGSVSPKPGNWTCENNKWVHKRPLNVTGDLVLPKASNSVVNGALNVSGNIIFSDYSSTLQSSQCITLLSNKSSVLFDLSSNDAIPDELGSRRDPSWYATVLFQEPTCSGSLEGFKLQVKNAPSCRKIQASHAETTTSTLKVHFKADFEICNTTYIVLGCSTGAILLLTLLAALIWCCCRDIKRPGYERLPTQPSGKTIYSESDLPDWTD